MARTIRDVALALDCTVGPEPTDLRSLPMPDASWSRSLEDLGAPLRIGWAPTLGYAKIDREVQALCEAALARLESQGTEIVPIDTVFESDPAASWVVLTSTSDLRRVVHLEGTPDWDKLDPGHVSMIEGFGRKTTALQLLDAEDECHRMSARLVEVFHRVPLLCTPTVAGQVGPIGGQGTVDGEATPFWISMTYPFNMTRSPAGSVCVGLTQSGLPVGLQIIGPQHGDVAVLRAMALLEDAIGFDQLAPI
jgi:Asp-tRNA(Asn)/Glu-tRNA(Gln) amidotransferase A subunit family amidase